MQLSNGQYLMFIRTAYMKKYKGINEDDKPIGGGKHVEETGKAHEEYNFLPFNSKLYGFFMMNGELNIDRLGASNNKFANNVLVIIIAPHPKKGNVIVGWYDHAKVYKKHQSYPESINRKIEGFDYNFVADKKDCFLVPEGKRIKLFPNDFTNKMRRTFNWYAEDKEDKEIVDRSLNFMERMLIKN